MYILPGYTEYREEDGALYVSSKLFQNEIKITDISLQKEFFAIHSARGCSALSTPLTQFLHEQGLLANREEIDAALYQVRKIMDEILMVTIFPTEGCNFRCPYCYETHTPVSMQRDTLNRVLEYIEHQISKFKTVKLGWFGGEPTLCKDVVLEATTFIQTLCDIHHINFQSSMTTNGYLLDIDSFKQYYTAGISSFQITIDGRNHDFTRPHISGKGTLDTILSNLSNITRLPKDEYQFCITIRHNVLGDDTDMSWYDQLHELFGTDSRFTVLIHPVGDWGGESVHTLNLLKGNNREHLILSHIDYLKRIGMQCANGRTEPFSKVCYACYPHSMTFRSDGRIEKCTVALDHPNNQFGYVNASEGITLDKRINDLWSHTELKSECYTCPDILSCLNMRCKKRAVVDGDAGSRCTSELSKIY